MIETDHFSIECNTCLASGTTACNDCVVTHLIANDDGPIEFLTVGLNPAPGPQEQAIVLFERAGLLDDPVEFVPADVFESMAPGRTLVAPAAR